MNLKIENITNYTPDQINIPKLLDEYQEIIEKEKKSLKDIAEIK